jgi:murein DD-endopeptidase MepM/ murein hydrolase activator NlpD
MKNHHQVGHLELRRVQAVFYLVAVLILSGCVSLIIKPYGHVASDKKKVIEDGRPVSVIMPEIAPSISQGYNPLVSETEGIKSVTGHHGIDIIAKTGTPVLAAAAGVVNRSHRDLFYGNRIRIDHASSADGNYFQSRYFHLKEKLVKEGDPVVRGQQIGTLGRTGLLAGFPHLHYEIRFSNPMNPSQFHSVNPHKFWAEGVGRVTCFEKGQNWPDQPFQTTYPVPCLGLAWR